MKPCRIYRLIAIVALLCASVAGTASAAPPLKNGVSLHGPLTWGRTTQGGNTYLWPVYEGAQYNVPIELLRKVKQAGFDFIRLSVDPGPFLVFTDAPRAELDIRLMDVVSQIRRAGLDVLVDFHPIGMVKAYGPEYIEADVNGLFPEYANMIRRTVRLLTPFDTDHVAIEPMNEPQLGYDQDSAERWQGMMELLYTAVRTESPDMTIVLTGGRGGSIEGLLALNPAPFALGNVRYSFHYYLPYIFTHQGVHDKNMPVREFATGLPYPGDPADFDRFWASVEQKVNGTKNLSAEDKARILADGKNRIGEYFREKGTRAAMDADFGRVSDWAKIHHIKPEQIFLGEFGATQMGTSFKGAQPEYRARWLADVRQEAESRGFHWSFWNLSGESSNGMVLVSVTDPANIDPLTAKALGKQAK